MWNQRKLREFCNANGIFVTAFSLLGASGTVWGSNRIMDYDVLKEIAEAKGKTVAQVLFFFFLQTKVIVFSFCFEF